MPKVSARKKQLRSLLDVAREKRVQKAQLRGDHDLATATSTPSTNKSVHKAEVEIDDNNFVIEDEQNISNIADQDVNESNLSKEAEQIANTADEVVDDYDLIIEVEQRDNEQHLDCGRRVIDVSHFLNELQKAADHGPLGCKIQQLRLVKEYQKGLISKFVFKCLFCNKIMKIESDSCRDNYPDVNSCAIAGTIAIGCGQSQLEELMSAMNLPHISQKRYETIHDKLGKNWEIVVFESMREAAEKEKAIAKREGRVSKDGIPMIDVVADGCWSKRSYKKNYSALSGAGAIIGKNTGQILYLGVKNKYCTICARAAVTNTNPTDHTCFKNYEGPSTAMESKIISEGFNQSIPVHGLIYQKIISDGDSATYKKILESRPYNNVTVEKIECRNHVLRNFCTKLERLTTLTCYPKKQRDLLSKKRRMQMRFAIQKSVRNAKQTHNSVEILFEDIHWCHHHAFGDHSKCKSYFCNRIGTMEPLNDKDFFTGALWKEYAKVVDYVANLSQSLIYDVDSNIVENYHSVVAKFVGGKRINFSKKNSYASRCYAAAVSFNKKKTISRLYKRLTKESPSGTIKKMEMKRNSLQEKRKKYEKPKRKINFSASDAHYGESCQKPDMPVEILTLAKRKFLESLKKTEEERFKIERETILQSQTSQWLEMRRSLLTASNFGKIIKRRPDTSCTNMIKDLIYSQNQLKDVDSIKHGVSNEKKALEQLELQENIKIEKCGLFIHEDKPYLGATPDGLVGDDMVVEIKCPITAFRLGLEEAVKKKKVTFWIEKNGKMEINTKHNWFFQIQGQLEISGRSKCLFAVWCGENEPMKIEIVMRDRRVWNEIEPVLTRFYMDCLLPELVDPRKPRNLPIRDPIYIQEAIEKKKKDKEEKEKRNIFNVADSEGSHIVSLSENPHIVAVEEQISSTYTNEEPTCSRYLSFDQF